MTVMLDPPMSASGKEATKSMSDPLDSAFAVFLRRLSGEPPNGRGLLPGWAAAVRAQRVLLLVLGLAVAFTIAAHAFPVTLSSRTGNTMIDTVASLISALAAFVLLERWRSLGQRLDLVIAIALGILCVASLLLAAVPTQIGVHRLPDFLQVVVALAGASAAVGLGRRSARTGNGLERSLALGGAVLAVAYVNDLLAGTMSSDRLYVGDMLKLSAFLLVLYGCVIEFRSLQRQLVRRVAVGERRRMARDMHDGLAQELAFIASHSQRLRHTGEDATTVAHLRSAAERALHDSRTTIAVLTAPEDIPLDSLIARTVESFRSRFGVDVELDLEHDMVVGAEERNALLRILHEALVNAVRHGSAERILVRLVCDGDDRPTLRIADDGSGFDVPAAVSAAKGLGLTSMQERAEILGGALSIASRPGSGTVVEVVLP
jgi:signal transduction histidine kinase